MNRIELTQAKFTQVLSRNVAALLFGAMLASCGGGGDVAQAPATGSTLSGVAAVGYPIVNGTVSVVCAAGVVPAINNTSAAGAWQVSATGLTLPCAVQVFGGTINNVTSTAKYHSLAVSLGTVNITPLTDLMVADFANRSDPDVWFAGLTPTTVAQAQITPASVNTALANLRTALAALTLLDAIDPITTAFTPTAGNPVDDLLVALKAAINTTNVPYATLLNNMSLASFIAPTGFNTALTTAFAGTVSGGAPPVSGNNALAVTNAPASVGGTFAPNPLETVVDIIGNKVDIIFQTGNVEGLTVSVDFDVAGGNPSVEYQLLYPNGPTGQWFCATTGPLITAGSVPLCHGITLNRAAGTVTFVNTALNTVLSGLLGTPTVTLNGTLRFTPIVAGALAPVVTLAATPSSIASGATSTLSWTSTNSTSCTSPGGGGTGTTGTFTTPALTATTTYTVTCTGAGGTASRSATVTVAGALAPVVTLTATPSSIASGATSTLNWTSTNSTSCISAGGGGTGITGTFTTPALTATTIYTVTCTGAGGSASRSAVVAVAGSQAPVVTIFVGTSSISDSGAIYRLQWSSTNSTSCTSASGGGTGTSGFFSTPTLTATTTITYTVTCTGAGGTASQSATVTVPASPSTPPNTFTTLNDTGITASQCYGPFGGTDVLMACNSLEVLSLNSLQDGMIGRDANSTTNSSTDGKLGFSFTAVSASGFDTGGCVQDNVTGLMWEVKTADGGLRDWNKTYTNYR